MLSRNLVSGGFLGRNGEGTGVCAPGAEQVNPLPLPFTLDACPAAHGKVNPPLPPVRNAGLGNPLAVGRSCLS